MAGGLVDNKMVMVSDENASPVFRWTWYVFSPGKVRQMGGSNPLTDRKTWQIVLGFHLRQQSAASQPIIALLKTWSNQGPPPSHLPVIFFAELILAAIA